MWQDSILENSDSLVNDWKMWHDSLTNLMKFFLKKIIADNDNIRIPARRPLIFPVIWLNKNDIVFNKCQPKTFLQVLFRGCIGYVIGRSCSAVKIKKRGWFRHVVCWGCRLFVSSHPMDGLLVYGLASNKHASYFNYVVRIWCGCYCL